MSHAAELLAEARRFERLALRTALRPGDPHHDWSAGYWAGARDARVSELRLAARRLRSLVAQWDDADDLDEWYRGLGAREICARGRAAGLGNPERADAAHAVHAA